MFFPAVLRKGYSGVSPHDRREEGVLHGIAVAILSLWFRHPPRIESFFELIIRENFLFLAQLADGFTAGKCFLGQFRGFFISDQRIEARAHGQALFNGRLAGLGIRFHIPSAQVHKRVGGPGEQGNAFKDGFPHDRHHDIELKLSTRGAADGDGLIVSHHPRGHLHEALAEYRIDFARHDRAARLAGWKFDFVVSTSWPASQPADVVRDVEEGRGDGP